MREGWSSVTGAPARVSRAGQNALGCAVHGFFCAILSGCLVAWAMLSSGPKGLWVEGGKEP